MDLLDLTDVIKKIDSLEKRVSKLEGSKTNSPSKSEKHKKKSLADAILDLMDEKFFDTPKNLQEIYLQLRSNAVFYPKTSYPDSLLRLVAKKKLRRLSENKKWVYITR